MTDEQKVSQPETTPEEHPDQVLNLQVTAKVFQLNQRKEAVMFALKTQGHLYIWGTDGYSDWLKKGDQTDYPYCLVVIDGNSGFPENLTFVPFKTEYEPSELDTPQITLEILEDMYREAHENNEA